MELINEIPELINDLQSSVPFYAIVFYGFAALIVASGLMTILSKKLMHSAIGLLFTFFGVAGLYAMLAADFVAVTQIMVYIGGILTLIIFGVMLTSRVSNIDFKYDSLGSTSVAIGAILAFASFGFLAYLFITSEWKQEPLKEAPTETLAPIGNLMMTNYLAAFIAIAILLLLAFIGAALIARRKN